MSRAKSSWRVVAIFAVLTFALVIIVAYSITRPAAKQTEKSAKFYSIQWLSGLTDMRIDAFALAALTMPKNGDMIEIIGFCRKASPDKIFGLSYAATFYEVRSFGLNDTIDLVGRGRKDHYVLAVFKKSQAHPLNESKRYIIRGVWHYSPGERPYIELSNIQEQKL
ncbi:MAG: hypothetical protein QMD77_00650 [Patescibacteria group bacterium]|nr:hypothetical protein [Patescibacteria group bacterium]